MTSTMHNSVFAKYQPKAYPNTFAVTLRVDRIAGGVPSDPRVADGWIRSKLGTADDDLIRSQVAETMLERGISQEEATDVVTANRHLNGFKRDGEHGLYIEGRQVKAAIKEAANVRWPYPHKWGRYQNAKGNTAGGKATTSFFAEHVFVLEDRIYLDRTEPSTIDQRFVHTWRGAGIQYEEVCDDVELHFTVTTDWDFTDEQWALLWLTGQQQGIGATRSQGMGRYVVTRWERS